MTPQEIAHSGAFKMSEVMARRGHPDIDEKFVAFEAAVRQNPALQAELMRQQHPWEFAYQQGKRLLAMQEIGDDPAAYKERLELLAELSAQQPQTNQPAAAPAPTAALPTSLATARSAAGRSADPHTGPTPFEDLFKK